MSRIAGLTLTTLSLLGGIAIAAAQPAPDPHHPNPNSPAQPAGAPAGMQMMDMGKMMPMMRMMQGTMMQNAGMGMMPFDHLEGRIAFAKTELGITDAQLPQWNAFADALRGSVKDMQTAMNGMMQSGMPTTVPARMDAMVQMVSARLDAMKAMQAAAKQLYVVLSDDQKKAADDLMTEHMMGGMRPKGMGER